MNTKDYLKILKEIPYRLYRKILYEFQRREKIFKDFPY